jgi:hypothetical protein
MLSYFFNKFPWKSSSSQSFFLRNWSS